MRVSEATPREWMTLRGSVRAVVRNHRSDFPKGEGEKSFRFARIYYKWYRFSAFFSPSAFGASLIRGRHKFGSPYGWLQLLQHRKFLHRADRVGGHWKSSFLKKLTHKLGLFRTLICVYQGFCSFFRSRNLKIGLFQWLPELQAPTSEFHRRSRYIHCPLSIVHCPLFLCEQADKLKFGKWMIWHFVSWIDAGHHDFSLRSMIWIAQKTMCPKAQIML